MLTEEQLKYENDLRQYIEQCGDNTQFSFDIKNMYLCLNDYKQVAGTVDEHYFFQDIYVASRVNGDSISHIYDVGSRLDGYISHLLCMGIRVTMIDIRPLPYQIENLGFIQGDATNLSGIDDDSVPALSCLHALEHFGLGRYGDPIDYNGWRKAMNHFGRILAPGGRLYLSVPTGREEKLMFNAHRIFAPQTIIREVAPVLRITEYTNIHRGIKETLLFEKEQPVESIACELEEYAIKMGEYDCGIYIFIKKYETGRCILK